MFRERIKHNSSILICVGFLTFTVLFYAPFEVYLQNTGEFWFNVRLMWWIPTLASALGYVLLCFVGSSLRNDRLKQIYAIMAFAGGFCSYIQGNFLNVKLGVMDGRKIEWALYKNAFKVDLLIWVVVIAAFLILGIWKTNTVGKICLYASILLIGMQLASFAALLIPVVSSGGLSEKYRVFTSDEHLWEVGEEENVIVFVLDSYDQNYMDQLIDEDNPELKKLDGFTYYRNYSGMFRSTRYGIIPLLTGKAYINQENYWEDLEKNGTFYDDLKKKGYSIDIYAETNKDVPGYIVDDVRNLEKACVVMDGVRLKAAELMYRLAWCKYLPDYVKCYLWLYGPEFEGFEKYESDATVFDWYNGAFRDGLEENGITVSEGKQYKFIHVYGAHEPYYTDRNLEDVPENWNVGDIPQGAMKIVTNYIEELKRIGVYDNTTMVITSDHGSTHEPAIISNSILLIKEKNSKGPLKECYAAVSEADFGATIVDLIDGDTEYDDEISALKVSDNMKRDRKYYGYMFTEADTMAIHDGDYVLVEYDVDQDDPSPTKFRLTGKGYLGGGRTYDHKQYCQTCLDGIGPVTDNNWMYWEHIETKGLE